MSTRPHSPGPFVVSQLRDSALIEDSDGEIVAELYGGDGRHQMASIRLLQGNATLLAASWDLLRAVRSAAAWLDDAAMIARLRRVAASGKDATDDRQFLLRQPHNAIARAEGRDPAMVIPVESHVLTEEELRAENDELERLADEMDLGDQSNDYE